MRFRGEYWFLSNMFPCEIDITLNGVPHAFTCAEAAFQACKCPARAAEFAGLDGFAAKKLGRTVDLCPDWEQIRLPAMEYILRVKFGRHPELMTRLRSVRGAIVEDNKWGDRFWGVCDGSGENHLGRLLMKLRDEAR